LEDRSQAARCRRASCQICGCLVTLNGSIRALLLFDISEEIDLEKLRPLVGASTAKREPAFRHPSPEYVRYERPPVADAIGMCEPFEKWPIDGRLRYFSYGIASVELRTAFTGVGWPEVISLANRWVLSDELEKRARELLRSRINVIKPALARPYDNWIAEDYYVIQVDPVALTAEDLMREYGNEIAQIVRGEELRLSANEKQEVLTASMSYYPQDLLVVGWVAAFVYDTADAAVPTIDLLEYANSQLLEFRHYDEVLTGVLADVYKRLEKKRSGFARWTLVRQAEKLNTLRLDYREVVERTENAIKFLSDMFYARAYRLAASRIGVPDYRTLVNAKLSDARDLYESLVNEFHQSRAFLLEVMVVVILLIEIGFLFRGK
jgi:hypothetical protein